MTSPPPKPPRPPARIRALPTSLTAWSLVSLIAGIGLGILTHGSSRAAVLVEAVKPIGDLWMAALLMTVLPLVVTQLLSAIAGARSEQSIAIGGLGARAVLLFVLLLAAAGVFTLLLAPPLIARYRADPTGLPAASTSPPAPEPTTASETVSARPKSESGAFATWLGSLIPRNLLESAVRGDVLPLLLFTVLFGTAVAALPKEQRDPLARTFEALARAMRLCVVWILRLTPAGVFALTFVFAAKTGIHAAGMLAVFVAIVCGLTLLFTILLYPLTAIAGRTSIRAFARAVAPAQLVAVSTRSSLAALPALVEGGRDHLGLPPSSTGFVLPLSVSLFKVNRTISSLTKLFFVAHIYGIGLTPGAVATFFATEILMSFTTAGVPLGGMSFKALPAYLAAGVPIEGVVILEAVETIPDIFKTLLNVTGDMSVAAILSRASRSGHALRTLPAPIASVPEEPS